MKDKSRERSKFKCYIPVISHLSLRHPKGTPTFKTEALRFVSIVQQLKRLIERLIQRYHESSLAVSNDAFRC